MQTLFGAALLMPRAAILIYRIAAKIRVPSIARRVGFDQVRPIIAWTSDVKLADKLKQNSRTPKVDVNIALV